MTPGGGTYPGPRFGLGAPEGPEKGAGARDAASGAWSRASGRAIRPRAGRTGASRRAVVLFGERFTALDIYIAVMTH